MVDTNVESIEIEVHDRQQSDQSIAKIVPAVPSTKNRRIGDTFSSELKSVSEKVDRLAETVFKSPIPKKKRMVQSATSSRSWQEQRDSGQRALLPSFHDSDD